MYPKYTKKNKKLQMNKKDRQPTEEWAEDLNRHLKIIHFFFLWLDPESLNFSVYLTYLSPFSSLEETNKSI